MRFSLNLLLDHPGAVLPVNYQYPLASAIYKIMGHADESYAAFLHEQGYHRSDSLKNFKLFTFSDIHTPFKIRGDRLLLTANHASLIICFHIPDAAEHFIRGLFMNQTIEIADHTSKASFQVQQVESRPVAIEDNHLTLQPISPVVCGRKNARGHYDFLDPSDEQFCDMLLCNWKEKIKSIYNEVSEEKLKQLKIEVTFFKYPPRSRLITIKADTPAETKIRGFINFKMKIQGNNNLIELLMNSGAGLYNAMGMGCVKIVK